MKNLADTLDKIASALQGQGDTALASKLDSISNEIDGIMGASSGEHAFLENWRIVDLLFTRHADLIEKLVTATNASRQKYSAHPPLEILALSSDYLLLGSHDAMNSQQIFQELQHQGGAFRNPARSVDDEVLVYDNGRALSDQDYDMIAKTFGPESLEGSHNEKIRRRYSRRSGTN